MSDMVERVKVAMLGVVETSNENAVINWDEIARAAIKAMREPPARILIAGDRALELIDDRSRDNYRLDAIACWQAMIDEALKSNTQYR